MWNAINNVANLARVDYNNIIVLSETILQRARGCVVMEVPVSLILAVFLSLHVSTALEGELVFINCEHADS